MKNKDLPSDLIWVNTDGLGLVVADELEALGYPVNRLGTKDSGPKIPETRLEGLLHALRATHAAQQTRPFQVQLVRQAQPDGIDIISGFRERSKMDWETIMRIVKEDLPEVYRAELLAFLQGAEP